MEKRNRNTAILLIAAGIFIIAGNVIGFSTLLAIGMVWFGVHMVFSGESRNGYLLLLVGVLFLLGDHLFFMIAMILISLGYYFIRTKRMQKHRPYVRKQQFMENMKWKREPWILQSMSIWCVIGEFQLDFSLALPEKAETILIFQGLIADIDLIAPEDMGVEITSSVLFGQVQIGRELEAGLLSNVSWRSPNYEQSEYKIKIVTSHLIGDVDVKWL